MRSASPAGGLGPTATRQLPSPARFSLVAAAARARHSGGMNRPRILVTGFSVFPGAPVNPTERLVAALRADPSLLAAMPDLGQADIRVELLPVEYSAIPQLLETFGREFAPDIAVHFGLSAGATGFTLERLARNGTAAGRVDNSGALPAAACIVEGAGDHASTLPLETIHAALSARGLPAAWSDDAGGYLCNYVFYLSRSGAFPAFAPALSGFVHVPPLRETEPGNPNALPLADLVAGAALIVSECARAWRGRPSAAASV